jgi:transcriptional regulator with XRE-family HTH domain
MPKPKPALSIREVLSRNLRRARRMKELSQEAVALEAGVTRTYLSSVELGTVNPSLDKLEALAKAVGVPLHDLINPTKPLSFDDNV